MNAFKASALNATADIAQRIVRDLIEGFVEGFRQGFEEGARRGGIQVISLGTRFRVRLGSAVRIVEQPFVSPAVVWQIDDIIPSSNAFTGADEVVLRCRLHPEVHRSA